MNLDFEVNYKGLDNTIQKTNIEINEASICSNLFECSIKKSLDNNKYDFNLKLTEDTIVDVNLDIFLKFNEHETIKSVESIFPKFSFKNFIPDQLKVITSERKIIFSFKKPYAFTYKQQGNTVLINVIIDAPYLHPAWDYSKWQRFSTAAPILKKGETYKIGFDLFEFKTNQPVAVLKKSSYPFGYKSAFILTDHCDFDTTEKLQTFLYGNNNNGWLNRGLKITKGVFALDAKSAEQKKSDSLENEEYKKLIEALFDDGSEIVHHALKHSGQLTKEEFHITFDSFAQKFSPKTWIDHGSYIKYCYSQGAKENPDFMLIETMKKHQYNNLWSFDDVNIDANQTLNILTNTKSFPTELVKEVFKKIFSGKFLIAGHYFRTIIHRNYSKNIVIDFLMYAIANTKNIFINLQKRKGSFFKDCVTYVKNVLKFNQFRNKEVVPYISANVLNFAQPLYLETRKPFTQYQQSDILMFYTFETTHLVDIYHRKSLEKLIQENGTHIGHTYILNDLPYINSIFKKDHNKYLLAEKWISFLDALQEKVQSKEIWNANMGEYAAYNILLQNIIIEYSFEGNCIIKNDNETNVDGFTFITSPKENLNIQNQKASPSFTDRHYNYYILNLPAQSTIVVSISPMEM